MGYLGEQLPQDPRPFVAPFTDRPHWYAVCTLPRHEKVVAKRLGIAGIETFLPTVTVESRWTDRRVRIDAPLFPGYVFARSLLALRCRLFSVPGVVRILSFGGNPAPIDDSEIESLKLCLERGATVTPHAFLAVGERVRVRSGVLVGAEGFVARCKNEHRLVVSISMINQSVAIEIDRHVLEPIGTRTL